jgi:hypothetical protein
VITIASNPRGRFQAQPEELRLYRKVAAMYRSAPIPSFRNSKESRERASALACAWQLNALHTGLAR